MVAQRGSEGILARCGFCRDEVVVPLREARATLRLALGLVTPSQTLESEAAGAARVLEESGSLSRFLGGLAAGPASLGHLPTPVRAGLLIALDEDAEAEALEAEWRKAEEMAAIYDGELSEVRGFDEFRRQILSPDE